MLSFSLLSSKQLKIAIGRGDTAISADIKEGLITEPIKYGPRSNMWPSYEIEQLVAARVAGYTNDQIRELVKQLHEKRKHLVPGFSGLAAPQRTSAFDIAGQALLAGA